MRGRIDVRMLEAAAMAKVRERLCEILIDCVEHGASVGFLAPLGIDEADAYWQRVERAVADRRCLLLVASAAGEAVAGTVQLAVDTPPNQPHRATVSKLLVHSSTRRRGLGEALMEGAERAALEAGRLLLTLDTATADAERLYLRMGWTAVGAIPDYALNPDRTLTDTVFYWKRLAPLRSVL